jgi:hypothetical protein
MPDQDQTPELAEAQRAHWQQMALNGFSGPRGTLGF